MPFTTKMTTLEWQKKLLSILHYLCYFYEGILVRWCNFIWWNLFFYFAPVDLKSLPKKPQRIALVLARGTRITAHVDSFRRFCRMALFRVGIQEIVIYFHPADWDLQMKSKRLRELLTEFAAKAGSEQQVQVKKRAFPLEVQLKDVVSLEEFIEKNVKPVDLVISFESCIHLWGLEPLSLANAEFAHVSWSWPFSESALQFALKQYAECDQRFGK